MDRFWQRPGNSNTTLSLSEPLSHTDTTNATEIPWYFFDASVVYLNPPDSNLSNRGEKF